ncbi:hypothetical protein E8F11_22885 [Pseudomonas sp. BN417]|uniref:hypothetical protein n=1 Tax=Pseudomonas sp. BN417 TaxID=2567890 RepID=UPI002455BAC7|nr:hypothetical protein [Pseudomonas sp. BN417]MDH4557985.1 hypothetical protein [Pseudomonas sp. BN417]
MGTLDSQTITAANTATITARELCELVDRCPSFFTLHRGELPQPQLVHQGVGRPAHHYSLQELADFALSHTSHLSDAECRLRCAIASLAKREQP